jgi:hypothetical protein
MENHPLPWTVKYWRRCPEWHEKSSPYIVDANGAEVVCMPQNVGNPGEYDVVADETALRIIASVNIVPDLRKAVREGGVQKPYLEREKTEIVRQYNPEYGDDRVCKCGHPYYRHFDFYEEADRQACGCKYCECWTFEEA